MSPEDFKKLATSETIFNLDRMIAPKIIKLLYLLGLATIVLWAINHLFVTFAFSFGAGLWGILEIAVFGLAGFVILRVICEALLVFFKKHENLIEVQQPTRPALSIFDDVKGALEELAEDDDVPPALVEKPAPTAAKRTTTAKPAAAPTPATTKRKAPARKTTAKRTPAKKAD